MVKGMTPHEFERLVVEYGSDLTNWPVKDQNRAQTFMVTDDGAAVFAEEQTLDGLLSELSVTQEKALETESDPFLARLADIPVYHKQAFETVANGNKTSAGGWLSVLFDNFGFLSPKAIVSQAATVVAVLGVGMIVGMSSVSETVEYDDYDISTAWYVGQDNYTELDLEEGS